MCLSIILFTLLFVPVQSDTESDAVADLLKAGEILAALALLEDLKPLRPCDLDLLFLEARVYDTAGETDRAIKLYETLIDFFPDFPEPYNNLAVLYAARGAIQHAEELLLQGIATHDTYRQLQNNLNRVYVARAAEAYRQALNIKASSADSLSGRPAALYLMDSETLLHSKTEAPLSSTSEC